jgi:hypothetical protein
MVPHKNYVAPSHGVWYKHNRAGSSLISRLAWDRLYGLGSFVSMRSMGRRTKVAICGS